MCVCVWKSVCVYRHSYPGAFMPFHPKTDECDVKYIVVVRNPEEAIVSMHPFLNKFTKKHWEVWDSLEAIQAQWKLGESFQTFFEEAVLPGPLGMPDPPPGGFLFLWYFNFINSWWPLRHEPNVLMLHFSEMKKDHEGSIRKFADFLGFAPTPEQLAKINDLTSFAYMKKHQEKYELRTVLHDKDGQNYRILEEGAMVRSGKLGNASADGMTPEIAAKIRSLADELVPDEAARRWMFEGGDLIA